jgi:putative addiction module component (TIGR02574 family)
MTTTIQTLSQEARKLSPDERLQLVDVILASLDATDPDLDRQWLAEAKDRYEAYKRGEVSARPLEEILAKYDRK